MPPQKHHRHDDRNERCEYKEDCASPEEREHKRSDDMIINKNSLYVRFIIAVLLGAAGSLGATSMAGWVMTPDKLQARIDNSPVIIQLRDKVDSLERGITADRQEASVSRTSIDERLFNMNGQLAAVAKTVGAEVVVPKQKAPIKPSSMMNPALSMNNTPMIRWSF